MIKRVNFTGRRRIPRNNVHIDVFDGTPRTFSSRIELEDTGLPDHAAVFLEAMCAGSYVIERFNCGIVGDLKPPRHVALNEIDGENVFFTLKVVDQTELGPAGIRSAPPAGSRSTCSCAIQRSTVARPG